MVKQFHSETWQLSMPREIWISKKSSLLQMADTLAAEFGIQRERILLTKINSPWSFHRVILPFAEWVQISDNSCCDSYVHSSPFYLSTDGILFIIRDSADDQREMTADEKLIFHCEEFESQMFAGGSTSKHPKGYRPQEAAVKITVKKKEE